MIISESGKKNKTLNNFVIKRNKEEGNNKNELTEDKINEVNLHKSQIRKQLETSPKKVYGNKDNDDYIDIDNDEVNTMANDEISNPFIKARLDGTDIGEDNQPTKDKNKNKNRNTSKKNKGKIPFKSLLDFFN